MFFDLLLIFFLILNPPQLEQEKGPSRINYQNLGMKTTAKSAIIIDVETEKILYEKNVHQVFPVASLTKLMTALVFLDSFLNSKDEPRQIKTQINLDDWEKIITMEHQDQAEGATLFIETKEEIKIKDLFYSMLVGSANNATKALVRSTGLSREDFVKQMNKKAQDLGLKDTYFTEPTGLDPKNVSTAYEIALLAKKAFEKERIREAVAMERHIFTTAGGKVQHTIKNTDKLLNSFLNSKSRGRQMTTQKKAEYKIIASKTGYLEEADYCLVSEVERDGRRVIGVVLGSKSDETRFREMKGLMVWVFENYKW